MVALKLDNKEKATLLVGAPADTSAPQDVVVALGRVGSDAEEAVPVLMQLNSTFPIRHGKRRRARSQAEGNSRSDADKA
jgi:hypothetical protein